MRICYTFVKNRTLRGQKQSVKYPFLKCDVINCTLQIKNNFRKLIKKIFKARQNK